MLATSQIKHEFILYGTLGCHLCEEAESLLKSSRIPYIKVDIAEYDPMVDRYGIRIPVLAFSLKAKEGELDWPFDHKTLIQWVHNYEHLFEQL